MTISSTIDISIDFRPLKMGPIIASYIVTDDEAAKVGLGFGDKPNAWGDIIAPLLVEKGCPEDALEIGNPYLQMKPRTEETGYTTFVLYAKS